MDGEGRRAVSYVVMVYRLHLSRSTTIQEGGGECSMNERSKGLTHKNISIKQIPIQLIVRS